MPRLSGRQPARRRVAAEQDSDVVDRSDGRGGDAMLELEAYLLLIATIAARMPQTARRAASIEDRAAATSAVAGAVQATLAFREMFAAGSRERVRARVERAIADIQRGGAPSSHLSDWQAPGMTLAWIDELDRAIDLYTELLTAAGRMGRVQTFEIFSAMRGYTFERRGDLANAAADIEPILAAPSHARSAQLATLAAIIVQVLLLVDDGRPDVAEARARAVKVPAGFEGGFLAAMLRHAQGAAQMAQGKFAEAAVTLSALGELCEAGGIRSPVVIPWRSDLALALAGTARHDEAVDLAMTELRLAEECDVDRARGQALRALGLLHGASRACGIWRRRWRRSRAHRRGWSSAGRSEHPCHAGRPVPDRRRVSEAWRRRRSGRGHARRRECGGLSQASRR